MGAECASARRYDCVDVFRHLARMQQRYTVHKVTQTSRTVVAVGLNSVMNM